MHVENPYDVLQLPRNASFAEVRAKYISLARKHHPDKFNHRSEEEKKSNEEYFKKVTVAYHIIQEKNGDGKGSERGEKEKEANMWGKMSNMNWRDMLSELDKIHEILKDLLNENIETKPSRKNHICRLPITLEELYQEDVKKVQLMILNEEEPLYFKVPCKEYPIYYTEIGTRLGTRHITCKILLEPHPIYRLDSSMQLNTDISVTLLEYIQGVEKRLPFLDKNEITIVVPPFYDISTPLKISGKGIYKKNENSVLMVHISLALPSNKIWSGLSENERITMQNSLNQINALFEMNPGL